MKKPHTRGFFVFGLLIDFTTISPYFGYREVVSQLFFNISFLNHFSNLNLVNDGWTGEVKEAPIEVQIKKILDGNNFQK